jgi:hypothetical protein
VYRLLEAIGLPRRLARLFLGGKAALGVHVFFARKKKNFFF